MSIQYVTDEQGKTVAVLVPIAEWEALRERIPHEPNEETRQALLDAEQGRTTPVTLEELAKEVSLF